MLGARTVVVLIGTATEQINHGNYVFAPYSMHSKYILLPVPNFGRYFCRYFKLITLGI